MSIKVGFHRVKSAYVMALHDVPNDGLHFENENGEICLYVPPHVAEHTAAAFNRAMQAVPHPIMGNFQYTTERQNWFIKHEPGFGWHGQSDEITGDGDPSWMFADAPTLIECMDEIDRQEAEEADNLLTKEAAE